MATIERRYGPSIYRAPPAAELSSIIWILRGHRFISSEAATVLAHFLVFCPLISFRIRMRISMTGLVPSTGVKDQDELEVESREYL